MRLHFVTGDEVYGACTRLHTLLENHGQAHVLRIRATFTLTLSGGTCLTCEQAVAKHLRQKRRWVIRSAGTGSKGERTYAWAWIATASPAHYLLVRKHRTTGELAFPYCFVPAGQPATLARLITAARLRWPVEESLQTGQDLSGLDESQVRLHEALLQHLVLVMAALAVCAVTTATTRHRTDTQATPPTHPDQAPPTDPGPDPADGRRDQAPVQRRHQPHTNPGTGCSRVSLATPPSSTHPLVPSPHPPEHHKYPAQLTNGDCRTRAGGNGERPPAGKDEILAHKVEKNRQAASWSPLTSVGNAFLGGACLTSVASVGRSVSITTSGCGGSPRSMVRKPLSTFTLNRSCASRIAITIDSAGSASGRKRLRIASMSASTLEGVSRSRTGERLPQRPRWMRIGSRSLPHSVSS